MNEPGRRVFAFVGVPAAGHINPTLPIVQRLVEAGDHVDYYAPEPFRSVIEHAGAEFRPLAVSADARGGGPQHPAEMRALLLTMAQQTPALVDQLRAHLPDVVVHDSLAVSGFLAARHLGLATVSTTSTFAFGPGSPAPGAGGRWWHRARDRWRYRELHAAEARAAAALTPVLDELGLDVAWGHVSTHRRGRPVVDPLALRGDATVVFTSRELQPAGHRFDAGYHFVGPATDRREETTRLPWDRLVDPLVYVSFGTMFTPRAGLLSAAATGLSGLGATVLLVTGPRASGDDIGRWSDDIVVRPWVPQLAVLDRAAVMVTHGGMNSVHEALLAGVPLVVVPHGADQPVVARRVVDAGAGVALRPEDADPAHLRAAVQRVLGDPSFAAHARRLGEELAAAGGSTRAAAVIRDLADRVRPTARAGLRSVASGVRR